MTDSRTPASDNGAPMRIIVGSVRQSGAPIRTSPRRSAMTRPSKKPPPRTITDARAAPSTPSRGNGPTPAISSGSSAIEKQTDPASIKNGVRVSPAARNVASIAKNPNTSGAPSRNTTGRSGPVVSEPATCLAGVACYQHKRVVVALHVPGDDVVGDLLRGARKRQRFRESVLDAVGKQNDGIAERERHGSRRGMRLLGADESRTRKQGDPRGPVAEIGAQ